MEDLRDERVAGEIAMPKLETPGCNIVPHRLREQLRLDL
jgi:hypothetical protein